MSGIYEGRLQCDGDGNLLGDDGQPVAYHDGSYILLSPGDPSHNERHHVQAAGVVPTQHLEPDLPGYAGTEDAPTEGMEHHFAVLADDPHYDGTKNLPDAHAQIITSHTEAYRG